MNIPLLFVLSIEQVIISLMYNPSTGNKTQRGAWKCHSECSPAAWRLHHMWWQRRYFC